MTILITGGAGFIGSNFILNWLENKKEGIVNFDKLTYAGNLENLECIVENPNYFFEKGDICDTSLLRDLMIKYSPTSVIHFAAESHVDRSIEYSDSFIQTNIMGTYSLLETSKDYWNSLEESKKKKFRFLHISTDEVYGSLNSQQEPFNEDYPFKPNSPYSATKAASDHLVRSWHKTYELPAITINCSNNYGPYQFPEKLIPLTILNALAGKPIHIFGDGKHVRDWIYVKDHCIAIKSVLEDGRIGQVYNIGGKSELENLQVAILICKILDELSPKIDGLSYQDQIIFITDRKGHDRRYAIDISKIKNELGWEPLETFETGIRKTVQWYLNNPKWVENVQSKEYQKWIDKKYGSN